MIDRLEELLEQVEEAQDGEDTALLKGLGTVPGVPSGNAPEGENGDAAPEQGMTVPDLWEPPLMGARLPVEGGSALPGLYRRLARASEGESATGSASVAVVRETVPDGVGLTAGELDLAMRRDSRRYDGAMTIY